MFNPSLTFHVALPAPPTAPNPGEARDPYFQDDFSSLECGLRKPATPEVPLGSSVRSRQPSLRNAYRRASPKTLSACAENVFRNSKSLRGEVIPNAAHRFAFANLELSRQRDVRASLGLDEYLGVSKCSSRDPALTAMRAADDCHPLPDQLHPCSWFSWICSDSHFYESAAKKIDAFHDAFDRFSGRIRFGGSRSFISRGPILFASPVSSPASALRFHHFEWRPKLLEVLIRAPHAPETFESGCSAERRVEIDLPELP